jgi:hypothetical protein
VASKKIVKTASSPIETGAVKDLLGLPPLPLAGVTVTSAIMESRDIGTSKS